MAYLQLRGIEKFFGEHRAIKGIDLTINQGEFIVFVGPSGCGKSTLLRLIAGLEDTTSGTIEIDGQDMTAAAPARRGLAMVFQSYALYPHMTVRNNIAFPLKMAKIDPAIIEKKVTEAARVLNLADYLERRPGQLSGGQRQRVAIGRAIVREPSAFLFDEPLSNLDAALRGTMRLEISELHQQLKTTMIYVTHDQVEAMTMADKIVVLRGGEVMQAGTPLDLYNRPANQFVAGFIGSPRMNFLPARASAADRIEIAGQPLALGPEWQGLTQGQELTFGIRPEHLVVGGDHGTPLTEAKVDLVEQLGGSTVIYATTPEGVALTLTTPGQLATRHGEVLALRFDPAQAQIFDKDGISLRRA